MSRKRHQLPGSSHGMLTPSRDIFENPGEICKNLKNARKVISTAGPLL
jgi:hypothetical protein